MVQVIKKFIAKDDGATAIEYGLIAAIIAIGIIPGVQAIAPGFITAMLQVSAGL